MTTLYMLHLSTSKRGMVKGPAGAQMGALALQPKAADVLGCLPHFYRAAFERANGAWWRDKHDASKPQHITLRDSRGRYLNTLYATPYEA